MAIHTPAFDDLRRRVLGETHIHKSTLCGVLQIHALLRVARDHHGIGSLGLDLRLGRWTGRRMRLDAVWLRFYDAGGRLIPTEAETAEAERQRAEMERQRAETERQRADTAEAEIRRLKDLLSRQGD